MNIRSFIAILFVLLYSINIEGQDLQNLMNSGNEFYQNKQYEEAIENYEAILKQGYLSSELYYNLGNAYFKKGKLGRAILFYEKSLKIQPNNEDAVHNLKIANARTVDKIQDVPQLFFIKWWNIILSTFTSTSWQVIIFIFYILLLICVAVYLLIRNLQIQKYAFIFGTLNIGALIFSVILFFASLERESSNDFAILQQSAITAKISPDSQSDDAFVIHEGIKFKIEDQVNNWVKIRLSDGKVGWLPNNVYEVI